MVDDPRIKSSRIAKLEGITTRTLYEHVKSGKFPQPDFPAETHGSANYWLASTYERFRDERLAAARANRPARRASVAA